MKIADWIGSQWIFMFSSEAEKVLSIAAKKAVQKVEYDSDSMTEIVNDASSVIMRRL